MSKILYPLRASAGWFASPKALVGLENHIKVSLICYDTLTFQDGNYDLQVTEQGSFDMPYAPEQERELRFYEGHEITFTLGKPSGGQQHTLISGPTIASYHVDFHPVLKANMLTGVDGVELLDAHLTREVTGELDAQTRRDARDQDLRTRLPALEHELSYVLKALHYDTQLAYALDSSVVLDQRISSLLGAYQAHFANTLMPHVAPLVYQRALRLRMPDVRQWDWDRVLSIRESPPGMAFREMIGRVQHRVGEEFQNLRSPQDLQELVATEIEEELVNEIRDQSSPVGSLLLGFALNLVPAIGPIAQGLITLSDHARRQRSWVQLLERD